MPIFTFTSPDGKTYDVQGPDGATKEQAFSILQQRLGSAGGAASAASSRAVAPLERLPGDTSGAVAPQKADDIAHKLLGLGEAGLSVATGALAAPVGAAYGVGKTLTSGKYGTQAGIEAGEKAGSELANRLTYQPRTQTGRDILQGVGESGLAHALQGLPIESPMIARIPEVPRGVLATGEGAAGAARAGANAVGRGTRAVVRGAVQGLPDVDPQTLQLARQAHTLGFRLTPDMVYGNKYARQAGELAQDNPFVGRTVREHNQDMFNHQLVYLLGGDGNRLTRQVFNRAMNRAGETIGEIAVSHDVPFNEDLVNRLAGHVAEAQRYQTGDVERVVRGYVDEITDRSQGGVLPGEAFRRINTRLNTQIRNTQNGDLRNALSGLQDDLQESFVAQLSPEDLNRYNAARRQYAVGKTLEPLVAKSPTGRIPPAALLGAVTRNQAGRSAMARGAAGDLGALADIGQRFLKEQPSSGTAERALMQNLLMHPVGTLAAGGAAALTAPAAAAYNRFGPEVTDLLIQRPPRP
ncbi:hypothetical protein [Burkholderia ubonensis]|uniref:hypothetical protein n=1 Tax=Burkholderia ubonensis TaxID=101571 RepID=UPI00075404BD|nr:hypothetical protein [Burkholderia ubonensis]KVT62162.1 hypothetical protein WK54_07585 [Burkholderia ubonensis]